MRSAATGVEVVAIVHFDEQLRGLRRYLTATALDHPLPDDAFCPEFYPYLRAARYLGVEPWALMDQPQAWTTWALMAEQAESEAQETVRKYQERQSKN